VPQSHPILGVGASHTSCAKQVPKASRASTPIHLLATAGLRMLPQEQSQEVLGSVAAVLSRSGFRFSPGWARILEGELEGLYAWVAFNFAAGTLQLLSAGPAGSQDAAKAGGAYKPPAADTWGVLELGGASLQVWIVLASFTDSSLVLHLATTR
jgi:apyrase